MKMGGEFNDGGHYHMHIFLGYTGDEFGWTYGSEEKPRIRRSQNG